MDIDDFAQPEVGVAVALTAVAASPSVRKTLRKGAAYGLAGILVAGDKAAKLVNAVAQGAQKALHSEKAQAAEERADHEAAESVNV
jgi:membrane protease subunit (stomatin/prohibitin family)